MFLEQQYPATTFFFHSNIWLKNHTISAATQNFLPIYLDVSKNIRQ
ncbi:hypothetical protein FSU_3033 [Fibrobacter succinogenes subsp. succinogenes S85]|uniref:Uncharacterized protein n=1 Tax=Fibrobacter succinogenes (strain ATCC 19169 / S85) TaxID=59374 RepID=D9S7Q0_FIBSS|nr:hypothetical protein FSU_3033 [Fibrobacter succinogenes subsp. succinogenes S85]